MSMRRISPAAHTQTRTNTRTQTRKLLGVAELISVNSHRQKLVSPQPLLKQRRVRYFFDNYIYSLQ